MITVKDVAELHHQLLASFILDLQHAIGLVQGTVEASGNLAITGDGPPNMTEATWLGQHYTNLTPPYGEYVAVFVGPDTIWLQL